MPSEDRLIDLGQVSHSVSQALKYNVFDVLTVPLAEHWLTLLTLSHPLYISLGSREFQAHGLEHLTLRLSLVITYPCRRVVFANFIIGFFLASASYCGFPCLSE